MVVTSSPSCMTASVRQELIRRPSTITVQAPHCPMVAALFRAGQSKMLTEGIEQRRSIVDVQGPRFAIHSEHHLRCMLCRGGRRLRRRPTGEACGGDCHRGCCEQIAT